MLLPILLLGKHMAYLREEDYEDSPDHVALKERLRKTLYYGKMPTMDRPSLAMTELAVELLHDIVPKELGKIDMFWASTVSREVSMSPCSLMLGLMYIKRLKAKDSQYLQQVSSSDLFLVSMMVASKYLYDEGEIDEVFNDEWARSANMDIDELNELERTFLSAMDWNLFVKSDDFWSTLLNMEQQIALTKSLEREGFTYTDLSVLAYLLPRQILVEAFKVVSVCSMAYFVGTMTIVSAHLAQTSLLPCRPGNLANPSPDSVEIGLFPVTNVNESLGEFVNPEMPYSIKNLSQMVESHDFKNNESVVDPVVSDPLQALGTNRVPTRLKPAESSRLSILRLPTFLTLALLKETILSTSSSNPDQTETAGTNEELPIESCTPCRRCIRNQKASGEEKKFSRFESPEKNTKSWKPSTCGCSLGDLSTKRSNLQNLADITPNHPSILTKPVLNETYHRCGSCPVFSDRLSFPPDFCDGSEFEESQVDSTKEFYDSNTDNKENWYGISNRSPVNLNSMSEVFSARFEAASPNIIQVRG